MKKIKIETNKISYNVFIGNNILPSLKKLVTQGNLHRNIFVIADENVMRFHKDYLTDAVTNAGDKVYFYTLRSGEKSKSFEELNGIIFSLIENNFGRDTLVIAAGGGVTGDAAGFAASVYMRGVQLAHIPTTLLAAEDSSVGGKTGINFNSFKNTIGTFYQPVFVLTDTVFFSTLPEEEMNSGAGELIKYAFSTNKEFYNYLNKNFEKVYSLDKKVVNKVLCESVNFKGSVISKDEYESGLRKILNFGHTFAHAYESFSGYRLKHGEAVCLGIISALFLSERIKILPKKKLKQFLELPLKMKLPSMSFGDHNSLLRFMYGDKKNLRGEVRFILLKDIGKLITDVRVNEEDILHSVKMTEDAVRKKQV